MPIHPPRGLVPDPQTHGDSQMGSPQPQTNQPTTAHRHRPTLCVPDPQTHADPRRPTIAATTASDKLAQHVNAPGLVPDLTHKLGHHSLTLSCDHLNWPTSPKKSLHSVSGGRTGGRRLNTEARPHTRCQRLRRPGCAPPRRSCGRACLRRCRKRRPALRGRLDAFQLAP